MGCCQTEVLKGVALKKKTVSYIDKRILFGQIMYVNPGLTVLLYTNTMLSYNSK